MKDGNVDVVQTFRSAVFAGLKSLTTVKMLLEKLMTF
jgi:hypothetical protein